MEGVGAPDSQRYTVQALNRAIDVLMAFSEQSPALTLGEVSARTRLSKPTAFRLLATLRNRGLIRQDPGNGKYELGFGMLAFAAVRARQANVRDRAIGYMRNIRDAVNETVVLSVREGDSRVHVDQVEGGHPFRRIASPGERAPLYAGAASKVLLAALSDGEVDDYLKRVPLVPLSATTVTNRTRLGKELTRIRRRGYAQGLNERNLGGAGVAAPVRDHTGGAVAVLHISVPIARYTPQVRQLCVKQVREGAVALSRELGYRAAPAAGPGARGSA